MPIFEFACRQCGKNFDLMISNAQKYQVKCPECGSSEVKQLLSAFSTSKSASPGSSNDCGGSRSPRSGDAGG